MEESIFLEGLHFAELFNQTIPQIIFGISGLQPLRTPW